MQYPKLEVIDHISDYYVKVTGRNMNEIFCGALMAITYYYSDKYVFNGRDLEFDVTCEIKLKEDCWDDLLIVFLNEVIFLMEENRALFCGLEIEKLKENEICAKLNGIRQEPCGFSGEIKAASYHDLNIKKDQGNLTVNILFDI